jgi:prevent-host-death family protein
MKKLEMAKATAPLAEYAQGVSKEPVIVTVRGKPIAALVAIENTDLETASLSTNPRFLALIERSRARQKAEGGISSAEMRRRLRLKRTARAGS